MNETIILHRGIDRGKDLHSLICVSISLMDFLPAPVILALSKEKIIPNPNSFRPILIVDSDIPVNNDIRVVPLSHMI